MFNVSESFPQLFAEEVGTLQGYQAKITLSSDAKPRFHKPRQVPYALKQKLEKELNRLQKRALYSQSRTVSGQHLLSLRERLIILSEFVGITR